MSYEALVLLPPGCPADLEAAEARLSEQLPSMQVSRDNDALVLSDDWEMRVHLCQEAYVAEESQGIVSAFGVDRPDADRLAASPRRFEVTTDPDPDMDHFNDFILAIESLTSFDGATAFDPQLCEFL